MCRGRTGDRELNKLTSTSGPSCICKSLLLHPRYVTHYVPTYNLKLSIIVFILSVLSRASLSKKYQSVTEPHSEQRGEGGLFNHYSLDSPLTSC